MQPWIRETDLVDFSARALLPVDLRQHVPLGAFILNGRVSFGLDSPGHVFGLSSEGRSR